MRICVFAGTFNPIHNAHLKMAEFALSKYGFEKIIFIPSYIPPHKNVDKALAKHRINMVKIATQSNPKFEVSDIEYNSEGKSYTLITINKIKDLYNIKGRIDFIIGTDAFKNIKQWYRADELKNLVHFIVFNREGYNINKSEFEGYSFEFADMKCINISSTKIREEHTNMTTEKVEDYIEQNGLYA